MFAKTRYKYLFLLLSRYGALFFAYLSRLLYKEVNVSDCEWKEEKKEILFLQMLFVSWHTHKVVVMLS